MSSKPVKKVFLMFVGVIMLLGGLIGFSFSLYFFPEPSVLAFFSVLLSYFILCLGAVILDSVTPEYEA